MCMEKFVVMVMGMVMQIKVGNPLGFISIGSREIDAMIDGRYFPSFIHYCSAQVGPS